VNEETVFYSLQPQPKADDLVTDLAGLIGDYADTAALLSQLDLIISVDTSVAHLAGALGHPVWLLLPHAPDWRWLAQRSDSPWYPSMRIFRQPVAGDWSSVLKEVSENLKRFEIKPAVQE
jgi:ADP-heptose:LPS heptosyltransferase